VRGADNSSPLKLILLQDVQAKSLRPGLILWYECLTVSKGKFVTLVMNFAYPAGCQNTNVSIVCRLVSFGFLYHIVSDVSETQASIFYV